MLQLHKPKKKDLKDVNVDLGGKRCTSQSHVSSSIGAAFSLSCLSPLFVLPMLKSEEKLLSEANCDCDDLAPSYSAISIFLGPKFFPPHHPWHHILHTDALPIFYLLRRSHPKHGVEKI